MNEQFEQFEHTDDSPHFGEYAITISGTHIKVGCMFFKISDVPKIIAKVREMVSKIPKPLIIGKDIIGSVDKSEGAVLLGSDWYSLDEGLYGLLKPEVLKYIKSFDDSFGDEIYVGDVSIRLEGETKAGAIIYFDGQGITIKEFEQLVKWLERKIKTKPVQKKKASRK